MVAALFVEATGPYSEVEGVDLWPVERDARLYNEAFPVVAHPPCARWSQLAPLVQSRYGYRIGDDGGCAMSGLESVRRCGGVFEHPAKSRFWRHAGLTAPPKGGGWIPAGLDDPGWTCEVSQQQYGHVAQKATWLYAVGCYLPSLDWRMLPGRFVLANPACRIMTPRTGIEALSSGDKRRIHTPPAFRDVLLDMARSVRMPA